LKTHRRDACATTGFTQRRRARFLRTRPTSSLRFRRCCRAWFFNSMIHKFFASRFRLRRGVAHQVSPCSSTARSGCQCSLIKPGLAKSMNIRAGAAQPVARGAERWCVTERSDVTHHFVKRAVIAQLNCSASWPSPEFRIAAGLQRLPAEICDTPSWNVARRVSASFAGGHDDAGVQARRAAGWRRFFLKSRISTAVARGRASASVETTGRLDCGGTS